MNELYIHMAVWDEPELDLPMVGSCGRNEARRGWKRVREESQREGKK